MRREQPRVLIVGGGELGSAVCHRLARSGMSVFVVDVEKPKCIRQGVCFAMACIKGYKEVEGLRAEKAASLGDASEISERGVLPVLVGDYREVTAGLKPDVVVDARMLKAGQDTSTKLAPLVIGLGPGFIAGDNVHVVVETNRGHDLGRLLYEGSAEPNTATPAEIRGLTHERVVRAPAAGVFRSDAEIGTIVRKGEVLGTIGRDVDVVAPIDGLLRGLIADGSSIARGQKIGDIDPRGSAIDANTISDKGRAVAGGVLEAILHWWAYQRCLNSNRS